MNFSEEWKSLWSISSVFSPPLLLSGPSAEPLGPLFFTPSPKTLNLLFSSPSLCPSIPPAIPLQTSLRAASLSSKDTKIPDSVRTSIAADFGRQSDDVPPIAGNNLQMLRCQNGEFLFLFPTGENSDRVGSVVLSVTESSWEVRTDKSGNIFMSTDGLIHRILKMFVTSINARCSNSSSLTGNSVSIGFLVACTLYSVHWFRVDINNVGSNLGRPDLIHLGMKKFSRYVAHACWSSHLSEECVVLLESGELFLFSLGSFSNASAFPVKMRGSRVGVSWKDLDIDLDSLEKGEWLCCEFGWHPRILIVTNTSAVFLVDLRFEESNVSILAKIEMFQPSMGVDRFLAFCRAGSDGFYFAVTTEYWLLLFDIRKPLMPVLQWAHGLDSPRYINVFRLSELRSAPKEDKYKWASESGSVILVGSFWDCEFSLFCYGPSLPTPDETVASKISKFTNTLYAWELPSELSLSGRKCYHGDCLLRENFSKATLPVWVDWRQKKAIVLGFCILSKDLSSLASETGTLDGFTLIRLMSSGKLESQTYHASWDLANNKQGGEVNETTSLLVEDPLLYTLGDQKYKFPRRFKHLKFDYLLGYLNGYLTKLMESNMQNTQMDLTETSPYTQDWCELIRDKLKASGIIQMGSSPVLTDVLNDIRLPASAYEIASRRMWAGLPMNVLQLAFSNYPELLEVLLDQKKVSLEFLDVPSLPQWPPFFLRKPSSQSNKWSFKLQSDDALVGPVLPLPVLLSLCEINKSQRSSAMDEGDSFSAEAELTHQCNEVIKVVNEMTLPRSSSEFSDSYVVSLADHRDERWSSSEEQQEPKPFFTYKPQAFSDKRPTINSTQDETIFEDKRFETFVCKRPEREFAPNPHKDSKMQPKLVPNSNKELVGLEFFDELCPVNLQFDSSSLSFGPKELKGYKLLKRQFAKWQEGFKPYQDFCTLSKIRKQAP
ncbi:PREDICTED: uncharacterized protein LOC104600263 [Nelumbo nucifera]|uniref:Uncharacterized protein LOC104600263 n=2 Tax=Nelumbo nucifera TaxID=4432 RepID=A0A1U8A8I1_NELNU|nr:PREDICTED: uncharacterized protein LOC104600263 [Nelumbo nucifera]XP_010261425.1 PREDICTED: uncharacterized protein LOC104600263 [Nelumbo nucifera]DAD19082.1 TPA_asm: hypothetical protein HUJ06_020545 [Nelumbo nucifera]